jgi:hypothetical protein
MKQLETSIKYAQVLSLGLCLAILSAGCSSVAVTRTVGLPGLTPLASAGQVNLVEEGKPVSQPYQVVGEVTVSQTWNAMASGEKPPDKNYCYKHMKEAAAAMGADGVIGVHLGMGADPKVPIALRSGLAVKWLAPGEARRPVIKPFVVAVLPMAEDSEAPVNQTANTPALGKNRTVMVTPMKPVDNQAKMTAAVVNAVRVPLELKGYYVLPPESVTYQGGLEGARDLNDAELQSLGGDDAQLLLEVAVISRAHGTIIISSSAAATVKTTLMDKTTRKDTFQGTGTGQVTLGWLVNMIVDKRSAAAAAAAAVSLNALEPIGEQVGEK